MKNLFLSDDFEKKDILLVGNEFKLNELSLIHFQPTIPDTLLEIFKSTNLNVQVYSSFNSRCAVNTPIYYFMKSSFSYLHPIGKIIAIPVIVLSLTLFGFLSLLLDVIFILLSVIASGFAWIEKKLSNYLPAFAGVTKKIYLFLSKLSARRVNIKDKIKNSDFIAKSANNVLIIDKLVTDIGVFPKNIFVLNDAYLLSALMLKKKYGSNVVLCSILNKNTVKRGRVDSIIVKIYRFYVALQLPLDAKKAYKDTALIQGMKTDTSEDNSQKLVYKRPENELK